MAPFGGYPLFNVNPQQYSSPYSITCYHSAPSAIFAPGRSFCLPSHIRPKCRNFGPLMERWEGHYMGFNHKLQFHRFLILEVWVCLQSLTRQESKKRQDHHSMDCNTKVQFQTFRIVVVMVYQPTPPQPQIPVLRASYGTSGPSLREKQPHLSFPTVFINIYIYY